MKLYKDSKEFPLENFERIESTGNFFYMIKGYEDGDKVSLSFEDAEIKYKELIQEYAISLNQKNFEMMQISKLTQKKVDAGILIALYDLVITKIKSNQVAKRLGLEIDNSKIFGLLSEIQIRKSDNLEDILKSVKDRIERLENEISEIESKLEKQNPEEKSDINEIITHVETILERPINLKDVSLYRFGIMQDMAKKKVEQLNKMQRK
ncbi:putative phage tail protein [Epilithonimonas hungarica]|uniref:hypothetical protein n=1 Tax=Epilithonimonas hungarica TaxID=454006 RepID=UPI002785CE7D|nr:hypothetical protein [Epilithonimonas hungarica]MDP9954698.1 putative phage tail protein [Epilithonimonas hungarica]